MIRFNDDFEKKYFFGCLHVETWLTCILENVLQQNFRSHQVIFCAWLTTKLREEFLFQTLSIRLNIFHKSSRSKKNCTNWRSPKADASKIEELVNLDTGFLAYSTTLPSDMLATWFVLHTYVASDSLLSKNKYFFFSCFHFFALLFTSHDLRTIKRFCGNKDSKRWRILEHRFLSPR